MKIKLFAAIAALGLFLGANVQADNSGQLITDEVMKTLDQDGMIKLLSEKEFAQTQNIINSMVNNYLADSALNFNESAAQYGWADYAKKALAGLSAVAKAIIAKAKLLIPKIAAAVKKVATTAFAKIKEYGPKAATKIKEIAAKYGPLAGKYAKKMGNAVVAMADAFGIDIGDAIAMAGVAAMMPEPPGGFDGFMKAMKKQIIEKLTGAETGEDTGVTKEDLETTAKAKLLTMQESEDEAEQDLAKDFAALFGEAE